MCGCGGSEYIDPDELEEIEADIEAEEAIDVTEEFELPVEVTEEFERVLVPVRREVEVE